MIIKFKKLNENAITPTYQKIGDAGADLVAISKEEFDDYIIYGTGIAVEIPFGYFGLIAPRSSVYKKDLILSNSIGIIDSGYRGEIKAIFKKTKENGNYYEIGDRIIQLIILKYESVNYISNETLSQSERGEGGFGSTGK